MTTCGVSTAHQFAAVNPGGCTRVERPVRKGATASFLAIQLVDGAAAKDVRSGHGGPADPIEQGGSIWGNRNRLWGGSSESSAPTTTVITACAAIQRRTTSTNRRAKCWLAGPAVISSGPSSGHRITRTRRPSMIGRNSSTNMANSTEPSPLGALRNGSVPVVQFSNIASESAGDAKPDIGGKPDHHGINEFRVAVDPGALHPSVSSRRPPASPVARARKQGGLRVQYDFPARRALSRFSSPSAAPGPIFKLHQALWPHNHRSPQSKAGCGDSGRPLSLF